VYSEKKTFCGAVGVGSRVILFFFLCRKCPAEELNDGGGLPLVRTPVVQKEKNTAGEGGQRSLRLYDFNLFPAEGACEINSILEAVLGQNQGWTRNPGVDGDNCKNRMKCFTTKLFFD
jgi:hypothetical protein